MGQWNGEQFGEEGLQLVIYQGLKCTQEGARKTEGWGNLSHTWLEGKRSPL